MIMDASACSNGRLSTPNMKYIAPGELYNPDRILQRSRKKFSGSPDNGQQVWTPDLEEAFLHALKTLPKMGRRKVLIRCCNGAERSLARNELISEYILRKTGKRRSRKQISSHIQVLKQWNKSDSVLQEVLSEENSSASKENGATLSQESIQRLNMLFDLVPDQKNETFHQLAQTLSPCDEEPIKVCDNEDEWKDPICHEPHVSTQLMDKEISMSISELFIRAIHRNNVEKGSQLAHVYTKISREGDNIVYNPFTHLQDSTSLISRLMQPYLGKAPIFNIQSDIYIGQEDFSGSKYLLETEMKIEMYTHDQGGKDLLDNTSTQWSFWTMLEACNDKVQTVHQQITPPVCRGSANWRLNGYTYELSIPYMTRFWAAYIYGLCNLQTLPVERDLSKVSQLQSKVIGGLKIYQAVQARTACGQVINVAMFDHSFNLVPTPEEAKSSFMAFPPTLVPPQPESTPIQISNIEPLASYPPLALFEHIKPTTNIASKSTCNASARNLHLQQPLQERLNEMTPTRPSGKYQPLLARSGGTDNTPDRKPVSYMANQTVLWSGAVPSGAWPSRTRH